jgi:hypothetical protein
MGYEHILEPRKDHPWRAPNPPVLRLSRYPVQKQPFKNHGASAKPPNFSSRAEDNSTLTSLPAPAIIESRWRHLRGPQFLDGPAARQWLGEAATLRAAEFGGNALALAPTRAVSMSWRGTGPRRWRRPLAI